METTCSSLVPCLWILSCLAAYVATYRYALSSWLTVNDLLFPSSGCDTSQRPTLISLNLFECQVVVFVNSISGPAEVDNDWSGRTSGFYRRHFQKEAQKDYSVPSGILLKIELGIR